MRRMIVRTVWRLLLWPKIERRRRTRQSEQKCEADDEETGRRQHQNLGTVKASKYP